MRPIHLYDLDAAVRAMLAVTPDLRGPLARRIVCEADAADRYRKRFRKSHPRFGMGTLTSAVYRAPKADAPRQCSASYRAALSLLISAIAERASHRKT